MARFLLSFCLLISWGTLHAQADSPLQGKKVGVYFSRKNFDFDDHYRIPLSQFVMADKGTEISIEDLKSQTLISLGSLFSAQLKGAVAADSVFFLNESPDLARAFMRAYDADTHRLAPIQELSSSIDYILVVNPLILGSYKTSSVYTRSNRLITEQVSVKTARVRIELFDPRTGLLHHISEACMDERFTTVPQMLFEFHMQNSQTGTFLSKLFSLAVMHLNLGVQSNCESK